MIPQHVLPEENADFVLSPRAQRAVQAYGIVCALLFLALGLTFASFISLRHEQNKRQALVDHAITIPGFVDHAGAEGMNGHVTAYTLTAGFQTRDTTVHRDKFRVPYDIWRNHRPGGTIPLTYASTNPDWFYVLGAEPKPSDLDPLKNMNLAGMVFSALSGLVLLIMLVKSLIWRDEDAPVMSPSYAAAAPVRRSFGARR